MSLFVFFILLLFSVHSLRSLFVVCWLFFAFVAIALPFAKCYGRYCCCSRCWCRCRWLGLCRCVCVRFFSLFIIFCFFLRVVFCRFAFNLHAFIVSLSVFIFMSCILFNVYTISTHRSIYTSIIYDIYIHKTPCNSINSFSFILQLRFDSLFLCIFPRTFTFQIEAYHNNRCQWLIISSKTFLSCFAVYVLGCMGVQYAHICVRFTFSHSIYLSFSLPYCLCCYTFIIQHNTVQHSTCWCLLISLK